MRLPLLLFAACLFSHVAWGQAPPGFQTTASQAILVDAESGAVLFEKQADKLFAPASMSKLMTLAVVFKKLKAGEISLDTEFPVSLYAWRTGGAPSRTTAMFIPLNNTAKVGDLIQGIMVQNANDACIALAEGLSGTDEAFAQIMTDEARSIGLEKSTFGNSTGLPNPANQMTAQELARLALHIIKEYPNYYAYFSQREFKYRSYNFKNFNPILNSPIGVDGLNVGFTKDVGYGITTSAVKDGRRLVAVMNGFETERDRREEAVKFLSWGFANFKAVKVFDSGEIVGDARVWGAMKRHMPLVAKTEVKILLPITARNPTIKAKIVYKGPLKPPVKQGEYVGEIKITSDAGTSVSAPVYAAEDLEPAGVVSKGIDSLVFLAFGWIL
jgi:serine-type D-Ala-D-Ala carboxypeptidase (penicillin-binding protein 5/6)